MTEHVQWWMWIVGFLLVLGPLVTVHEFGHYLVGRWCGVKADVFSIGFGKELFGRTDKRGTRWRVSALPLGGYVQFAGDMSPVSQPSEEWLALPDWEREVCFQAKPLWQRTLIVAAGPVTNLLFAIAIIAAFNMTYGRPVPPPPDKANMVGKFIEDSPAERAGVKVGDRIVAIGGVRVADTMDVTEQVVLYPGRKTTLTVARDGHELTLPITFASILDKDRFGNQTKIGRIGIYWKYPEVQLEPVGPVEAVRLAFVQCGDAVRMTMVGLGQILSGQRSVRELGGPVRIAKYSGEQLSLGWDSFVSFIALISINLAFINLLPIPALDGGHLAFYAAEAIRRKPVGPRSQEWAFRTGVALVLALMLFVTINDIASLAVSGN